MSDDDGEKRVDEDVELPKSQDDVAQAQDPARAEHQRDAFECDRLPEFG